MRWELFVLCVCVHNSQHFSLCCTATVEMQRSADRSIQYIFKFFWLGSRKLLGECRHSLTYSHTHTQHIETDRHPNSRTHFGLFRFISIWLGIDGCKRLRKRKRDTDGEEWITTYNHLCKTWETFRILRRQRLMHIKHTIFLGVFFILIIRMYP